MARLSEEHFKSNPGTPKPERKPSRFREIFKPRTSTSSSSPNSLNKSPPASSPLASPTMKPGYEKVGLLPSERSSFEFAKRELEMNGGMAVSEAIEKEDQAIKSVSESQNLFGVMSGKTKEVSERSIGQSFKDALSKQQNEYAEGGLDVAEGSSSTISGLAAKDAVGVESRLPRMFGNLSASFTRSPESQAGSSSTILKPALADTIWSASTTSPFDNLHGPNDKLDTKAHESQGGLRESKHVPPTATAPTELARKPRSPMFVFSKGSRIEDSDNMSVSDEHDSNGRKSYASNIFDDNDTLSQGIREYVGSKIAEALLKHEHKQRNTHNTAGGPIHCTINVETSELAKTSTGSKVNTAKDFHLFVDPVYIGSVSIPHPRIAQLAVIVMYLMLVLNSAFAGPKELLLSLWRIGVALGVYAAANRCMSSFTLPQDDVFLAPVVYMGRELQVFGRGLVQKVVTTLALVLAEVIKNVVKVVNAEEGT